MRLEPLDITTYGRAMDRQRKEAFELIQARALGRPVPYSEKAAVGATVSSEVENPLASLAQSILDPTILAQLIAAGALDVPTKTPLPSVTGAGSAAFVEQGHPGPVGKIDLVPRRLGSFDCVSIHTFTRETAQRGGPAFTRVFLRTARLTHQRVEDAAVLSTDAATASTPEGLLHDQLEVIGGSPADDTDVGLLFAAVTDGAPTRPAFIASPRAIAYLARQSGNLYREARVTGGTICGCPLLVSPAAANRLILVDLDQIAIYNGPLTVEESGLADLQMSDTPSGAAQLVSMFQTNSVAVKLIHSFDVLRLSDDAAAYLTLDDLDVSPA